MKNKLGLLIPIVLILLGAYALVTTLGSSGEQVALVHGHPLPRGLALIFGLLGLGGGTVIILTALSNRKRVTS